MITLKNTWKLGCSIHQQEELITLYCLAVSTSLLCPWDVACLRGRGISAIFCQRSRKQAVTRFLSRLSIAQGMWGWLLQPCSHHQACYVLETPAGRHRRDQVSTSPLWALRQLLWAFVCGQALTMEARQAKHFQPELLLRLAKPYITPWMC